MLKGSAQKFRMYAIRAIKQNKMLMKTFMKQLQALEGREE